MSEAIATYRVQLTPSFGFDALAALAPYLTRLGISHVYISPCLEAVSGSAHGYDVTDPTRVREDFGGESSCARAFAACREHGLSVVLDIVPNHMAASAENPWWRDLLRWGEASAFAHYFDVDWARHDGRVVLPILGVSGRRALAGGEIQLRMGVRGIELCVGERTALPVAVRSLPLVLGGTDWEDPDFEGPLAELAALCPSERAQRGQLENLEAELRARLGREPLRSRLEERLKLINGAPERLAPILAAQYYELRFWRAGLLEINYRRFFDISDLAAVRVEDREVFDAVHVRLRDWLDRGWISGVRVDHPDGLKDPEQYFERLRALVGDAWVLAEKVLGRGEQLRRDWEIDGTTGYDFLNVAGRLFVEPSAEPLLTATYCRLAELPGYDLARAVRAAKGRALRELFGAEVAALTARALPACQGGERGRPFSAGDVQRALVALITGLPVYRTYLRPGVAAHAEDRAWLEVARLNAVAEQPELSPVVARLVDLMLGSPSSPRNDAVAIAFQQLSGPAMAKGLEDTVFYDDSRLLALNEVGGNPAEFAATPEQFHAHCEHVQKFWPKTLLATSTHDTKRSADVRLRIALLSEVPDAWAERADGWMRLARRLPGGSEVDPRTLYFLLQTLVGVWPISVERLQAYVLKAVREAKAWTSWLSPALEREAALAELVAGLLSDERFTAQLDNFVERLTPAFRRHSLALTLLGLTAPGVPDLYQGSELWNFSLADPDNRSPVDYPLRRKLLDDEPTPGAIGPADNAIGAEKLWLIRRALQVRRSYPDCFGSAGAYIPLRVTGPASDRVVAFARGTRCVCIAPVRTASLSGWEGVRVELPPGRFCNALDADTPNDGDLPSLLLRFPVALLVR